MREKGFPREWKMVIYEIKGIIFEIVKLRDLISNIVIEEGVVWRLVGVGYFFSLFYFFAVKQLNIFKFDSSMGC